MVLNEKKGSSCDEKQANNGAKEKIIKHIDI
jgi:hypothetical protein